MNTPSIAVKEQVLQELATGNRLIGDLAEDYGVTRRTIYAWIKSEQRPADNKSKAIKVSKLKSKLAQINDELQQLQIA